MKKILLAVLMSMSSIFVSCGHSSDNVIFYGVDFTHVKVYAADESVEDFENVFKNINILIMDEATKYNFSKVVSSEIDYNFEPVMKMIKKADFDDVKVFKNNIPDLQIEEIIEDYKLPERKGTGLIIIPQILNKASSSAKSYVVLFDIDTREILKQKFVTTKAGGFGLRNYWARPFYNITLSVRL